MAFCVACGRFFINLMRRRTCPTCGAPLRLEYVERQESTGIDPVSLVTGLESGVARSPDTGAGPGALVGAALHGDMTFVGPSSPPAADSGVSTPCSETGSASLDGGSCDSW
jgi:hypothetical protein